MKPLYTNLSLKELERRAERAWQLLNPCRVCPRKCLVNRQSDDPKIKRGFCQVGPDLVVSSYHPHHWEERCISGNKGSGIIFFASCNLACIYCQNFEISQLRIGQKISFQKLGKMMLELQKLSCHNINLCSPSIYVPQILKAALFAIKNGLNIPFVYNTGGYDSLASLKLLRGVIDIYMPDIKYSDSKIALKYSLVPNYWPVVKEAVKEMYSQVGDLVIENGLAKRGLLVRHLVLPENLAGTKKVMEFLVREVSKDTYVNIMDQYHPTNKAYLYPKVNRRITKEEFEKAIRMAKKAGLHRFDKLISF